MSKSYFIVFEGIDGSGKGEQIERTQGYLFELDKRNIILTTREPTYGKYGMEIRKLLKEDTDPHKNAKLMLELYTKDRQDHLETLILPFLKRESGEMNHIVLSDRYYYSTYAYQWTQGNDFKDIYNSQKKFPKPDLTILFDIKPGVAMQRISNSREENEKFEEIQFMKKLSENYLKLRDVLDKNIVVIDGSQSKDAVFEEVKKTLHERLDI